MPDPTQEDPNILTQPTNEYAMRHIAGLLGETFGHGTDNAATMSASDLEVINFAYQQLHRGANTLRTAKAEAWDEGAEADADCLCLNATPCGVCANCQGPELVNPYRTTE